MEIKRSITAALREAEGQSFEERAARLHRHHLDQGINQAYELIPNRGLVAGWKKVWELYNELADYDARIGERGILSADELYSTRWELWDWLTTLTPAELQYLCADEPEEPEGWL